MGAYRIQPAGSISEKEGGALKTGQVIGGKYQLVKKLGQGGEGSVYLARHLATGAYWAVKILPRREGEWQIHELQVSKGLRHPGILQITDILEEGEYFCLIMEYIRGGSLKVRKNLSADEFLKIAWRLSRILVCLHTGDKPVLHLDLKPSNILLKEDGFPVLIDFGIAMKKKGEQTKSHLGTRGYAAPEQYDPLGTADERTDIYGFGAAMYFVFYGKRYDPAARPSGPAGNRKEKPCIKAGRKWEKKIRKILMECLREEKEERLQDSRELQQLWEKVLRSRKRAEGRRQLLFAVGVLAGAAGLILYSIGESLRQPERDNALRLLEQAEYLGLEQAVSNYQEAIRENPREGKAYRRMLERMTEDGNFSLEEEADLKEVIYGTYGADGKTVLEYLKENEEEYGSFAYEAGMAYWYDYEGSAGRSAGARWFEEAEKFGAELDEPPKWQNAAAVYARIGKYYSRLLDREEQETVLPVYWEDLSGLYDSEKGQMEERVQRQVEHELLDFMILYFHVFSGQEEKYREAEKLIAEITNETHRREKEGENPEEEKILLEKAAKAEEAVERIRKTQDTD